ncbi:MAG: RnfABCDGE type electron transport complex subunit D [Oscillospiraceae bacterium]|jgi:electron transport complex protein RnfD|nr:RnfABCDGE type electron transport complex subunit D [Oscillospiraceae bacterium]MCI8757916.1 RnfABCDGE type electron transport complex subunit D [Oscillospiraceae bacterium]MCI9562986.1 RnfABCDGE type electron transport complex subunit D [Oscillospiraceae bacterium]
MNYKELNLIGSSSPHIRTKDGAGHIMGEVLIAMALPLAFAVYNFGPRALATAAVSAAGCCAFEWLYRAALRKDNTLGDLSAAVTGVLIAFVCPVTIPYWILLIGDFFAIVFVKQLFGGIGKNFLNPALAARAFMLSWAGEMTTWVGPRTAAPIVGAFDAATYPTPMALLHENNLEGLSQMYDLPEMLVGLTGGSMGEVSALLLVLGGLFLIFRKVITWYIPVSYIGTVAALTFLFPRGNDPVQWMLYNLLGGGLMLGAFFMATDYVTSPVSHKGQVIFGVGCGLITVFIRYFGSYSEGVCYAILVMNLTVWLIDKNIRPNRFGVVKAAKSEKKEAAGK